MKIQLIDFGGKSPERAHANDAGADVFSPGCFTVVPGQELLVRQEDKDYQIADTHRDMYVLYCEKKLTNRN